MYKMNIKLFYSINEYRPGFGKLET